MMYLADDFSLPVVTAELCTMKCNILYLHVLKCYILYIAYIFIFKCMHIHPPYIEIENYLSLKISLYNS